MSVLIYIITIALALMIIFKFIYKRIRSLKNVLPNKVVLITGASSGIGEALAHVFYVAGCRLVLSARRKDELERVRKDLLALYSTTVTHPPVVLTMDVSDINSLKDKAKQALDIHGHIDILINNSGISFFGEVVTTQFEAEMKVMMTNYFGTAELTRAILPSMIKRRQGRIVGISSVLGKISVPHRAPYSVSKHAMQAFFDCLRAEIAEHNVKVTLISPGFVDTSVYVNALTSTGKRYGKVDENVLKGVSSMDMAKDILRAILSDDKDVTICQFYIRIFYWMIFFWPDLFFYFAVKLIRDEKHKLNFLKSD